MMAASMDHPPPSEVAIDLLKSFEQGPKKGFSPVVYRCPAGQKTIGWGHRLMAGERFQEPITEPRAERLLRADLMNAFEIVRQYVTVRLTQSMVDALCSFVFNLGAGRFLGSSMLDFLNSGDYVAAADEFPKWNKASDQHGNKIPLPGLTQRRKAERELFLRDGIHS